MTSFYYLYKYGTCTQTGKSMLNANGALLTNNFLGSYLQYNRFDTQDSLDFLQDGTQDSTSAHTYTDFYNQYKTIVGSDFMSYINKYSNTTDMALGDMVNFNGTTKAYSNNLVSDANNFYFRTTQDTSPYRYTENGSAEALLNTDADTDKDFDDLQKAYSTYYDYIVSKTTAGATPDLSKVVAGVDLSDLGISYSQILSAAGNDPAVAKQIYQNLVNQLVKEATAIKAGTMTQDDIVTAEKELQDKQRALKALDDALYGYVEDSAVATVDSTVYTLNRTISSAANGSAAGAINSASLPFGVNPGSGTTNAASLLDSIGSISVMQTDSTDTITEFTSQLKNKITDWVDNNSSLTPFGADPLVSADAKFVVKAANTNTKDYMNALQDADRTAAYAAGTDLTNMKTWVNSHLTMGGFTISGSEVDNVANILWVGKNKASFTDKTYITNWVNTNYGSVTNKSEVIDSLWRDKQLNAQKASYIDALLTAIKPSVAMTPSPTTVQTKVFSQDITQRNQDHNYTYANGTMYFNDTNDLNYFLNNVISAVSNATNKWEDDDWEDHRVRSETRAVPACEIYNVFNTLGIHLTTDAEGKNSVATGMVGGKPQILSTGNPGQSAVDAAVAAGKTITWETGGAYSDPAGQRDGAYGAGTAESIYAWLAGNMSAVQYDGDGKFHFTYTDGKVYYLNSNALVNLNDMSTTWNNVYNTVNDMNGRQNIYNVNSIVQGITIKAFSAGSKAGGIGSLGMRHLKAEDITKSALAKVSGKVNTDENSLVYQLAKSLLDTAGDIAPVGTVTDQDKAEFAAYLSEVTAGIMEQYWVENLNNPNAEVITDYFAREFRAYLNPKATDSTTLPFNFVNSAGVVSQFNLNFSEDPKQTTIVDRIMQKQSWAQILSKMEDRSRAELALFEESAALDTAVNINTKEFQYRMAMLAALEKDAKTNTVDVDFSKVTKNLATQGPGKEQNPWWSKYFPWFKGYYGNLPNGATADQMFDENGHLTLKFSGNGNLVDPYLIKINDVDYVMGVDKNQDGKINNAQEILGIEDTIETTFASLVALDKDHDGYVSQEELKSQNIILKAVNTDNKLNGSTMSTDFVKGIDLSKLEKGDGTNKIYGLFQVDMTNGQKAAAVQTFETQSYFNNLFSDYADLSFLKKTTSATTATATTTAAKQAETASTESVAAVKGFNFFSYLSKAEDTTTAETTEETTEVKPVEAKPLVQIEEPKTVTYNNKEVTVDKLIDELCWKLGVDVLSSKQRYDILGSVDMSQDSDIIVRKVQSKINGFNTQFSA